MGAVFGLPVGLSFFGAAWSEAKLIRYAYAFEQATRHRFVPRLPRGLDPREHALLEAPEGTLLLLTTGLE